MRLIVISAGFFALAGCASRESPIALNAYQPVAAPAAPVGPIAAPQSDYRINPSDELRIDVFGEPDLSLKDLPVSPTGQVRMPMVGAIKAEGRTTGELSRDISQALNHYLRNPQVAVNVTKFTSQTITVGGAVRNPGAYQVIRPTSLIEALAMGQGLSDQSKRDEVFVFRRKDGQQYVARFDMNLIENSQAQDPDLQPGDTVVVGYSNARTRFSNMLAVLPAAVGIFIALIR